jgi:hypothetical protein
MLAKPTLRFYTALEQGISFLRGCAARNETTMAPCLSAAKAEGMQEIRRGSAQVRSQNCHENEERASHYGL